MLIFVIPLKSSQVSKSWEQVCKLFERCIKSVCNQTSDQFRVIVVCHEKPQIEFSHPHITYVEVDFPAPVMGGNGKGTDRARKILVGLNQAQQLGISEPIHIMNVDADDCISKHIAAFVAQHPQSNGWFVNKGYLYPDGSRFIYLKRSKFHQWCGTSNIVRADLLSSPEKIEGNWFDLNQHYSPHRKVVETLAKQGTPLSPLPFAGTIYILGHGESWISSEFNKLVKFKGNLTRWRRIVCNYRPMTNSVRDEFGIYNLTQHSVSHHVRPGFRLSGVLLKP